MPFLLLHTHDMTDDRTFFESWIDWSDMFLWLSFDRIGSTRATSFLLPVLNKPTSPISFGRSCEIFPNRVLSKVEARYSKLEHIWGWKIPDSFLDAIMEQFEVFQTEILMPRHCCDKEVHPGTPCYEHFPCFMITGWPPLTAQHQTQECHSWSSQGVQKHLLPSLHVNHCQTLVRQKRQSSVS